jgi:hypothetical protein
MKKTLLLTIAACFIISAMGQPVNEKTQISVSQKQQKFDNLQSSSGKGERLDSTITDTWTQPSGPWVFSSRSRCSYTVVGFTTTCITSKRDASTSFIWVNTDKAETTVDANGKTTLYVDYDWSGGVWVGSMKTEYTFDGSGNLTSYSSYTWNTGTSAWVGIARTVWTYTGGVLTLSIGYSWVGGAWATNDKTDYTYVGGILTQDITSDWTGGAWVTAHKTDYSYTGGKLTLVITSNWTGSAWVNFGRSEYTFDGSGNQTLSISYTWSGSTWTNSSKTESTYASGKLTSTSFYNWSGGAWVGLLRNEYTYGVSGGLNYVVTTGSMWMINQWVTTARSTNWYSGGTTGINKFSDKNIRVYPNPAREFIAFDFTINSESAIVEIFDIQGKKVLEQRLSENRQISVSNLPKGLYIYKLNNGGIIYTGKLLKE